MTLTAGCARCGDGDGVVFGAGEATVKGPSFAPAVDSFSFVLAIGAACGLCSVMQMRVIVAACSSFASTSCFDSKRISCSSIVRIRSFGFTPATSAVLEGDTPTTRHCVGDVSDVLTYEKLQRSDACSWAWGEKQRSICLQMQYLESQRCVEFFIYLDTDLFPAHGRSRRSQSKARQWNHAFCLHLCYSHDDVMNRTVQIVY